MRNAPLGPPVVVFGIYDFSVLAAISGQKRDQLKCMNRFIVPCKFLPLVIYDRCLATICCAGISVDTWDHFAIYFWYATRYTGVEEERVRLKCFEIFHEDFLICPIWFLFETSYYNLRRFSRLCFSRICAIMYQ